MSCWSIHCILFLLTIRTMTHVDPISQNVQHKHTNKHILHKRSSYFTQTGVQNIYIINCKMYFYNNCILEINVYLVGGCTALAEAGCINLITDIRWVTPSSLPNCTVFHFMYLHSLNLGFEKHRESKIKNYFPLVYLSTVNVWFFFSPVKDQLQNAYFRYK